MNTLTKLRIGALTGVSHLQLAENLTDFPEEIFTLADTLEVLDLSNNQLSDLPANFAKLTKLKRLFLSFNQFQHIPRVLSQCPELIMIAFKGNQITEFSEHSLPQSTQWLILTDNQLTQLPHSMGELTKLKKLALAGNQLTHLPVTMQNCTALELVRLSANKLTQLDDWLFELPKLTWLAFAGNEFNRSQQLNHELFPRTPLTEIELDKVIGQGASGIIHSAQWQNSTIAVKLFKGAITSDGYPLDEVNCCLQAQLHPNLIKVLAYIEHNEQLGLAMELIAPSYANLGLPPSLETCTRDTFKDDCHYSTATIYAIAKQLVSTVAHLHQHTLSHGDIYAHNIMINENDEIVFGDFGAATNLVTLSNYQQQQMQRIEVRAIGCLIDDLLSTCNEQSAEVIHLQHIAKQCMNENSTKRPTFEYLAGCL